MYHRLCSMLLGRNESSELTLARPGPESRAYCMSSGLAIHSATPAGIFPEFGVKNGCTTSNQLKVQKTGRSICCYIKKFHVSSALFICIDLLKSMNSMIKQYYPVGDHLHHTVLFLLMLRALYTSTSRSVILSVIKRKFLN